MVPLEQYPAVSTGTAAIVLLTDPGVMKPANPAGLSPRDSVRLTPRIGARDSRTLRRHQDHLRATELLTRLLQLHLMAAFAQRIANVSRNPWLDTEPFAPVPTESRCLDGLLRR
jgi:hypothetical protein